MKLTDEDKKILKEWGCPDEDLDQIELATSKKHTTYEIDNRKATLEEVLEAMDKKEYLSGIVRSAFHWSACRETKDGRTVYFNSSKLFK